MAQLNRWMKTNRIAAVLIVGVVAVLVVGAAFLGIARATDKPGFCGSACHEMGPYHDAWSAGPHKDVICIECHVDESESARLAHKFEALKEVAAHVKGDTSFPRTTPAVVPDQRCLRCHEDPKPKIQGFNHAAHSKDRPCVLCHRDAGHRVTPDALLRAGILNTVATSQTVSVETTKAAIDAGTADLAEHLTVGCSRCHTMSKTPCSACHTAKHKPRGECSICHKPDFAFVFTHPTSGVDCASCHKRPARHTDKAECTSCHPAAGKNWRYPHEAGAKCADCHDRPAKHREGSCATCHKKAGKSWAFTHPNPRSNCSSCHSRTSSHWRGQCSTCHKLPGRSWAFTHPRFRSDCRACHARPKGMPAGQCSNCHRLLGRSWAFTHPRIRGGEHSYRSFPCKNCHPKGYASYTCIKCHDSATRGGDD